AETRCVRLPSSAAVASGGDLPQIERPRLAVVGGTVCAPPEALVRDVEVLDSRKHAAAVEVLHEISLVASTPRDAVVPASAFGFRALDLPQMTRRVEHAVRDGGVRRRAQPPDVLDDVAIVRFLHDPDARLSWAEGGGICLLLKLEIPRADEKVEVLSRAGADGFRIEVRTRHVAKIDVWRRHALRRLCEFD